MQASLIQSVVRRDRGHTSLDSLASTEQMNRVIRRECARADRNGREFSLVLFRVRSDARHAVSVHRLARTVLRRARMTDEVGWFSDRYLCVLLPDTPPVGARAFAEGVCDLVAGRAPRPLAIVYSYPEHWVASGATKDLVPDEGQALRDADRFAAGDLAEEKEDAAEGRAEDHGRHHSGGRLGRRDALHAVDGNRMNQLEGRGTDRATGNGR